MTTLEESISRLREALTTAEWRRHVRADDLARVLAVAGEARWEWRATSMKDWTPINRLPHTWERELGVEWRERTTVIDSWVMKALQSADEILEGHGYAHTDLRAAIDYLSGRVGAAPPTVYAHCVDSKGNERLHPENQCRVCQWMNEGRGPDYYVAIDITSVARIGGAA